MPFNDAGLTDRFLSLAQELWITAKACRNPSARTRQRESAIALEMLTLCPIRRSIFAAIHVDRDPQRHGPGYPEWGEAQEEWESTERVCSHLCERFSACNRVDCDRLLWWPKGRSAEPALSVGAGATTVRRPAYAAGSRIRANALSVTK